MSDDGSDYQSCEEQEKNESDIPKTDTNQLGDGNKDSFGLESKKTAGCFRREWFECCPWAEFERPGACNLLKWKLLTPNNSNIPRENDQPGMATLDEHLPVLSVDAGKLKNPPAGKIQVTWIGHATVYVQFDGISLLTDPVFGEWCGPWIAEKLHLAYKRYRRVPCEIRDLPTIDAVLISHNHYDHLEQSAVREISTLFNNAKWFVTLEQKQFLVENGVEDQQIVELDWWQEKTLKINEKDFTFICTPSQHWCQRWLFDMNKVLWCSWVIKGPTNSFYFPGDTGYFEELFKEIGKKYGPFDLAAIPIGAYEPRFITKFQHVDPEEAVKIHKDIGSKQSIGIHWGTFELTNEFYAEPPQKVEEEMKKRELDPKMFVSLCHGETWCVGDDREPPPFMKAKPPASQSIENLPIDNAVKLKEIKEQKRGKQLHSSV